MKAEFEYTYTYGGSDEVDVPDDASHDEITAEVLREIAYIHPGATVSHVSWHAQNGKFGGKAG